MTLRLLVARDGAAYTAPHTAGSRSGCLLLSASLRIHRCSSTVALSTLLWRRDGTGIPFRVLGWCEVRDPAVVYLRTYVVQIFVIVIIIHFHHIVLSRTKVINGLRNDLFLDDLPELVIHLEPLIQFVGVLVDVCGILCGRGGGSEEVEEGFGGAGFTNQRERQPRSQRMGGEETGMPRVLCFFISNSFVSSLSPLRLIVVP